MKMLRTAEASQVPPLRLPERNVEKTNDGGGFTIASGAVLQLQVQMVLQLQVRMVVAMTVMPTAWKNLQIQNWRALGICRSDLGRAASEWQFSFSLPHPHGQAVRQRPTVKRERIYKYFTATADYYWSLILYVAVPCAPHGQAVRQRPTVEGINKARRLLLELDSLRGGALCN